MTHLLSDAGNRSLRQIAAKRLLLAFDFDGTLAPIVNDRDAAGMRTRTQELFTRVCELYPCAVVSGRARADVTERLGPARVKYVVGNHGLEPGGDLDAARRATDLAVAQLSRKLSRYPGIDIEDKIYSLALHYRRVHNRITALRTIEEALASLSAPVRTFAGKLVVNVVPEGGRHKGDAVIALREREKADAVLYAGDDVTDEDVFALDPSHAVVAARIGRVRDTAAQFYLRRQREVDTLLSRLIALRG